MDQKDIEDKEAPAKLTIKQIKEAAQKFALKKKMAAAKARATDKSS
jgi:hypothetical protein